MQVEVGGLVHVQVLLRGRHSKCHPPLNPTGEIGSGYPTNIYDDNRLSLPILRKKMVQSYDLMYVVLPDGYCNGDQNTLNKLSVSEKKITLNNHITNN
jgi:hypothetical protein